MTVKLVVLYAKPDDADAFDKHYFDVHLPMADKIPGLQRMEASHVVGAADGGAQDVHIVTELYFADQDALQAGMGSEDGKAAVEDFGRIAPSGSRIYVAAVSDR